MNTDDYLPASLRQLADQPHNAANRGTLEWAAAEVERLRAEVAGLTRERDAVCRYAAGFLTAAPESILENALAVAGHIPGPLRPSAVPKPADVSDLVGHVCSACGTRATRVGDSKAIWCERCGTGRWVSKPKPAIDHETLTCPQCKTGELIELPLGVIGLRCNRCGYASHGGQDAAVAEATTTGPTNPPLRLDLQRRRLTRCQADEEEPCDWPDCPQVRDGEPKATGRHCPLDVEEGDPHAH